MLPEVVKDALSDNKMHKVLHFEMCTESPSVFTEMVKSALHSHVVPAEVAAEELFSVVQLPHVGLHKPGQKGVSQVSTDEG